MNLSYAILHSIVKSMIAAVTSGPPDKVAHKFSEHDRALVAHTCVVSLFPLLGLAAAREGIPYAEVVEDIEVPGLDKAHLLRLLHEHVPPLLKRAAEVDTTDAAVQSLKRNPNDDVARAMFNALSAAISGAFDVLDTSTEVFGLPAEGHKGVTAGVVSLAGAIIHALNAETGVSEEHLYKIFRIPEKHIPAMTAASQSTQQFFREHRS